jgi:hypothetical protein
MEGSRFKTLSWSGVQVSFSALSVAYRPDQPKQDENTTSNHRVQPVGERKSGMPAAQLAPAPIKKPILHFEPSFNLATSCSRFAFILNLFSSCQRKREKKHRNPTKQLRKTRYKHRPEFLLNKHHRSLFFKEK